MPYPPGLHVDERPPPGGWGAGSGPTVVFVHGSLDRGASFARTIRRLRDLGVVTYDRRGYQASRDGTAAAGIDGHIADLLGVVSGLPGTRRPVTAIGHSLGGNVVVGAALADPAAFASIGAYEPPMPWLGLRRHETARRREPSDGDPGAEAERFFRRMVGGDAWDRLSEPMRAQRRLDGPALVADLTGMRGGPPFDVERLGVPAVFARGGPRSAEHHRQTVAWLAEHVPGAQLVEIPDAAHGAHLSHPDAFAALVRAAVRLGAAGTAGAPAAAVNAAVRA